ncbi:M48 family metallopeptidase [Thiohalophilus sp.]|uniref:M48 family metallopeptidase n=1 Tax=Thiohalophilus sp. TaxID=3028392 RepID=UPI002ACD6EAA|nr:M48 family metallopeptidase [Thiohalophilus sp.]MDZ7661515.1 M48 family metallopeptidase [Thiohalophilus sp.]
MERSHYWLAVLIIALVSGCATSPTGRSQLMLISPETAISESEKAYIHTVSTLGQENKLVSDPAINQRVQVITGRLVNVAIQRYPRTRNWKWSVAVIDDAETVNAWAMAGGRMAVYTGLLEQLKLTDAELAQIMGHEIAHALANHTAEQMSVALATQLGVTAVGIATEASDKTLTVGAIAAQLAVQLPNSRTAEAEADRIGIELAARAGYDPQAAVTLWQKMAKAGGDGPPQFLSTHPAPGNRQATLAALVPKMRQLRPATLGPVAPVTLAR